MNYILFDDNRWQDLRPLTLTRPVADIRIGILTIKEKWEKYLGDSCSYKTQKYLEGKFKITLAEDNILINGGILPTPDLVERIKSMQPNEALCKNGTLIAIRVSGGYAAVFDEESLDTVVNNEYVGEYLEILFPWDIFTYNGPAIIADFALITAGRTSQPLGDTNRALCPENIFIEEGAVVQFAILNASTGPIYIGKDAEIMENSVVRGPFALCEHAGLKLATKIYGPTTVGPHSRVGGEVNNSVIQAYSNKGHDGFLGNSVIGEWCNLGADTNNSNLKNNYGKVKMWSYTKRHMVDTGLQFCGLIMGDHSKCAINTSFNTGTVVGVCANIFGAGFPRNFIPSFSWGGANGLTTFILPKAYEVAERVMSRRAMMLSNDDRIILEHVFIDTEDFRNF